MRKTVNKNLRQKSTGFMFDDDIGDDQDTLKYIIYHLHNEETLKYSIERIIKRKQQE